MGNLLKEKLLAVAIGAGISILISILLFDSFWGMVLAPGIVFLIFRILKEGRLRKERLELAGDFSSVTGTVTGALLAGYSMENAWREAYRELSLSHPDKRMCAELKEIINSLDVNENIEDLIWDFAERSEIEDIQSFAEVFCYSKRAGANQIGILEKTTGQIKEKQEIAQEIEVMVSEKKLEQNIMNIVPVGMLLYLRLTAGEYLSTLYHNLTGVLIMTVCLIAYSGAFFLSKRILRIEV